MYVQCRKEKIKKDLRSCLDFQDLNLLPLSFLIFCIRKITNKALYRIIFLIHMPV